MSTEPTLICSKTHAFRSVQNGQPAFPAEHHDWLLRYVNQHQVTQARICFHASNQSSLHHMLVYHHTDHIVRPHSHPGKSESLIIHSGTAILNLFTTTGNISNSKRLSSGDSIFMPRGIIHSIRIVSPLLFEEVTIGPFSSTSTVYFTQ